MPHCLTIGTNTKKAGSSDWFYPVILSGTPYSASDEDYKTRCRSWKTATHAVHPFCRRKDNHSAASRQILFFYQIFHFITSNYIPHRTTLSAGARIILAGSATRIKSGKRMSPPQFRKSVVKISGMIDRAVYFSLSLQTDMLRRGRIVRNSRIRASGILFARFSPLTVRCKTVTISEDPISARK